MNQISLKKNWFLHLCLIISSFSTLTNAYAKPEMQYQEGLTRIGVEPARLALVLFPGAFLESHRYFDLANELVEASGGEVSVYFPDRLANFTNPIEAKKRVQTLIDRYHKLGVVNAKARIFIGGHSEGGIASFELPVSMDLGGLVLFGSYVPRTLLIGQSIGAYRKPVLTLGGEVDGLTGINYLAREALTVRTLEVGDKEIFAKKPVIVIPGMNHMQFADGSELKGDMLGEISLKQAHQQIARVVLNFLEVQMPHSPKLYQEAFASQKKSISETLKMIKGYTETQEGEVSVCVKMQKKVAPLGEQGYQKILFDTKLYRRHPGDGQFILDKSSVRKESAYYRLHIPVFVRDSLGLMDVSKDHALSADSIWCKMRTAEALSTETELSLTGEEIPNCGEMNAEVIKETLSFLTAKQVSRLEAIYGGLKTWRVESFDGSDGSDKVEFGPFTITNRHVGTGQAWILGSFDLKSSGQKWVLETVEMQTNLDTLIPSFAGAHYCKLINPARIIEWATLFALKN